MKARPAAESGAHGKAVQQMFAGIAHRYDFLNHLLSASIDRRWRKVAVHKVAEYFPAGNSNSLCLDLCSGTGDLALELGRRLETAVVASDFCHPMLVRSLAKVEAAVLSASIRVVEADSLVLPFAGNCFDAVTVGFGLRNLEDPLCGLEEMRRVLKDGGVVVILEFSRPVVPVFREAFQLYFHHVLPRLGAWISGQRGAYQYLPDSVRRFPAQRELASMMESVGFQDVSYRNLSGGIAALHWGRK